MVTLYAIRGLNISFLWNSKMAEAFVIYLKYSLPFWKQSEKLVQDL